MRDLTSEYMGEKELSLWVFNDPYFVNEMEADWMDVEKRIDYVIALVQEEFKYREDQWMYFMDDLEEYVYDYGS